MRLGKKVSQRHIQVYSHVSRLYDHRYPGAAGELTDSLVSRSRPSVPPPVSTG